MRSATRQPRYDAFRPDALAQRLTEAGLSSVVVRRDGVPSHPLLSALGTK